MSIGPSRMTTEFDVTIVAGEEAAVALRERIMASGVARVVMVREGPPYTPCDVLVHGLRDATDLEGIAVLCRQMPDTPLFVVTVDGGEAFRAEAVARGAQACRDLTRLPADALGDALRCAVLQARCEQEERRHDAELHTLLDLGVHPTWTCDPATLTLLTANRAALETYGYSREEFRARSIADLRAATGVADGRGAEGLPPLGTLGLERHRRKDGSEIEVELFTQTMPLRGRELRLVQARDVTAERRAMRALEASERRFRDFFEQSTGYICIHDLDGTLLSVNPAATIALGRSAAELLGLPLRELAPPQLRFLVDNYLQRIARSGEDAGYMRVLNHHGDELVWQYRNRLYTDADGASYVMGYAQDITAMRAAERAFRLSERRLRTIADTLPLKIAYLDAQQHVVFANEAWRRVNAPYGKEVTGWHVRDLIGASRYARRQPFLARAFAGERVVFESEEGEGEDYACLEITFIPEFAEGRTEVIGVHAMLQDVTAKKREEHRLIHLARIDNLTGLLNRAGFYERLDNALARSRDQDSLLALLYLDVDRFKQVNDTHGHAAGDALLREFAARLTAKVRTSDVIARLGGDEFTIIMEGVPDPAYVEAIAAKLVATMQRPFELQGGALTLSVGTSIGIALGRAVPMSAADLVARADTMLYAAKQAGRGAYRLTTIESAETHEGVRERAHPAR